MTKTIHISVLPLCLALLLCVTPIHSHEKIDFEEIPCNSELSNSSINTIFQDSDHLIWIGTWDGLNRYDGHSIIQYRPSYSDPMSISHQVIRSINEDKDKQLWIATDGGINCLDKSNGTFKHYLVNNDFIYEEEIFSCCISKNGRIATGVKGSGIYLYHKENDNFLRLDIGKDLKPSKVLFFDKYNRLWIEQENHSLACINIIPQEDMQGSCFRAEITPDFLTLNNCHIDQDQRIWFIENSSLKFYDIYDDLNVVNTKNKIDGTLKCINSTNGKLFIGTTYGLYELTKDGLHLVKSAPNISTIYYGSQNKIWVGTDGYGINYNVVKSDFISTISYPHHQLMPIRAIIVDQHGDLWFGSKGDGLWRRKDNRFTNYNVGPGRTQNSVLSLEEGHDCLWIGTDGKGLRYYDFKKDKIIEMNLSGHEVGKNIGSIYTIKQITPNTLYLGTSGQGLFEIHITQDKKIIDIVQYKYSKDKKYSLTSNVIYDIIEDGNHLWLGTRGGGLLRFNKQNSNIEIFRKDTLSATSICSNDIITLLKDENGNIWIGTTSGLTELQNTGNGFISRHFTEIDGLPNTNIHAMAEDSKKNIWISTSNGIAMISHIDNHIKTWKNNDGLRSNEFSDRAGFIDRNTGIIYFGNNYGLNAIDPAKIKEDDYKPEALLYNTLIDNKPYHLRDNLIQTDFKTGSITMNFSIPDYITSDKCELEYAFSKKSQVEQIKESEWIHNGKSRSIILNNLSAGNYYLYVKTRNAEGYLQDTATQYQIHIAPPKSLSKEMILLYIILLTSLYIGFQRVHMKHKRINKELENEKKNRKIKEDIHKSKLIFFKNIAREFSNSITMIFGAIDQANASEINENIKKQLSVVRSNTDKLHTQIQRLLEFGQMEQKNINVQYEKIDIPELVKYSMDNFIDTIDAKNISVSIDVQTTSNIWILDRNMMERIIFNLLSNAMTHTPKSGRIDIQIETNEKKQLMISISNTGKGIPSEELNNMFNRYCVLENFESKLSHGQFSYGSIGLAVCKEFMTSMGGTINAQSIINDHTTIYLSLPEHQEEEICSPAEDNELDIEFKTDNEKTVNGKIGKVLVIDSQKGISRMICEILSTNYDTISVKNKEQSLQVTANTPLDLIIFNDNNYFENKSSFIRELRNSLQNSKTPIILLSDDANIENRVKVLQAGIDLFINKPFHPKYLKAVVDRLMLNRKPEIYDLKGEEQEVDNNKNICKTKENYIQKINDILDKNYSDENYNQDNLAYDMAVSRVQLYRKTKEYMDTTPGNYIRLFRLRKAEEMLLKTSKTVQEIMYDCGFHNKAYFYREFTKLHNCSPKDYRLNNHV